MEKYKYYICAVGALFGNIAGNLLGGWDLMVKSLVVLMILDYVTGLSAAIVGKSPKSESGRPNSYVGFVGLVKKGILLIVVMACVVLDNLIGSNCFIRNSCIAGFCVNEIISLIENAGLFGVDIPNAVSKGLEVLKSKGEGKDE